MPLRALLHDALREAVDPLPIWQRVVGQCLHLLPTADGASLELLGDDGQLEYVAAAGKLAPFVGLRIEVEGSLSGLTVQTGRVQRSDDAVADPRVNLAAVQATGIRSMLCVPVTVADGAPAAALKVSSSRVNAFTEEDGDRLLALSSFLGFTLRSARDLASVTDRILDALNEPAGDDRSLEAARFVANVLAPGLFERVDAAHLIDHVLTVGQVPLVVQPIVDLASRRILAVEALARFLGPPNRAPDWWFDTAHSIGRGVELELHALRAALDLLPQLPAGVRLSVNLGPEALVAPDCLQLLATTDASRITIELTEHARIADVPGLLAARNRLRELGIWLGVDDAGSGYAGLSHLRQLLPDVIKIDRDLVSGVDTDPVRQALCTALIDFSRRIDARILGEGIEAEAEAAALLELGVERGQGYLFGRPMPLPDFRHRHGTPT